MPVVSINPKYKSKWDIAKKMFNDRMVELDNDGSKTIQYFADEAAHFSKAARANPNSGLHVIAKRCSNAAQYGVNLAFGIDLAAK